MGEEAREGMITCTTLPLPHTVVPLSSTRLALTETHDHFEDWRATTAKIVRLSMV
jgi:hypothetical protein